MRLEKPRIQPLSDAELTDELRELVPVRPGRERPLNVFTTFANHPKLMERWMVFAGHVLGKSTLSPRDREILILRTGFRCNAEYEWGQHVVIGRMVGLSEDDLARIAKGPEAPDLDPFEATLLRAADELHDDQMLSDATWAALGARYDTEQLMDVVFAVGQYTLVSMALNTFGVQLDEGVEGFAK